MYTSVLSMGLRYNSFRFSICKFRFRELQYNLFFSKRKPILISLKKKELILISRKKKELILISLEKIESRKLYLQLIIR